MSLSSSLFSGISGLTTFGNAMQIIGDNISNVNTVGFKGSSFTFQDLVSQSVATLSGTSQVGRGTALGDVSTSFSQGSLESTSSDTDLAINGDGFFIVKDSGGNNYYYTRAGSFSFDQSGYLTTSDGYVVQGWALDSSGNDVGSITDIQLSSFTSAPDATDYMQVIANLDADGTDGSSGSDTALAAAWDGTATTALDTSAYEYQTTISVYDSLGNTHDITIYFDQASSSNTYEFIVTCNASEDARSGASGNTWAGLLGQGTITFDTSGTITNISFSQIDASDGSATAQSVSTDLTSSGNYTFDVNFLSGSSDTSIELNLGATYSSSSSSWISGSTSTTMYSSSSSTTYSEADGYGAGDLESVTVSSDGTITGSYSNGQLIPLYRLALANFQNEQGLYKEGGSLYSETLDSGSAITNKPGTNGLGTISANSLEQSNVDVAEELVSMITTQRGFQANAKVITVTDEMLSDLINIKR